MVKTGSKAVIGSWKIIAADRPRSDDMVRLSAASTSTSSRTMLSAVILAVGARRRISAMQVTDLPEPDSPTMPRLSPSSTCLG